MRKGIRNKTLVAMMISILVVVLDKNNVCVVGALRWRTWSRSITAPLCVGKLKEASLAGDPQDIGELQWFSDEARWGIVFVDSVHAYLMNSLTLAMLGVSGGSIFDPLRLATNANTLSISTVAGDGAMVTDFLAR